MKGKVGEWDGREMGKEKGEHIRAWAVKTTL